MKKQTVSWMELQGLISKICRTISTNPWKPDYVVGITRGGLLPALMISHYFDIPCETLKVSLRDHGGDNPTESNLWMAEDAYNGKNILIVDDINDTGATINWIIKDWPQGCFPDDAKWNTLWNHNVKFAAIFDNLASKADVKMDFVGREINKAENNVWIDFPFEDWWVK